MNNLDQAAFDQWKANPVTQQVLRFLDDWKAQLIQNHTDSFIAGEIISEIDQAVDATKIDFISQVVNLKLEDMEQFYGLSD